MNFLVLDTSTELMSVGVSRGRDAQQWLHSGAGGAQASNSLIATILDLMAQAQLTFADLSAIGFGCGPGSFTGLRTACSVVQGLAFGAKVPVLPVDSLLVVAEDARHSAFAASSQLEVTALLDARMDEMYTARYAYDSGVWQCLQEASLLRPEALAPATGAALWAGNVFGVYADRLAPMLQASPKVQCVPAMPTAAALLRLAPGLMAQGQSVPADHALPTYIRDKVAKTTVERMAEKAAVQLASAQAHGG
ncbi:tRNA (adenosine(37)-N6)-threonylcarbamoyltransferase complex dimerization subunit type 1 TsaB [Rhodoferax aquaticus]|uniref:tRNA (Adenosine(37)-N6)-threonylcarbamoyltransferase complex dimerization subunit type 1 TsaB n=1 Tax=Rhodoferax aquaticus TaxID=2527691 RepID=A0A515EJR8_9BURK|nr:tRNA (adenosine(37)-N6)-threonylcarbamoyltransferase complex dimerization subunit type 1 TsaB [Rhodoferax aquaticus]QDL52903.1 tRNA (adenosine(37)-N6)-threonylcarbamoyltransferase complex dimerization subunit type 1 TsaB [Rhodoferax aquaticus]